MSATALATIAPELDRLINLALFAGYRWQLGGSRIGEWRPVGDTSEHRALLERLRREIDARWPEVSVALRARLAAEEAGHERRERSPPPVEAPTRRYQQRRARRRRLALGEIEGREPAPASRWQGRVSIPASIGLD